MSTLDLRELKARLIEAETRHKRAEAESAELALVAQRDMERDRLAKPGKIRHLYINDMIVPATVDKWISALTHWEIRDPGEDIEITISSPGGSVLDGFALLDTILRLRRKGHRITTRGTGMVASFATVLMQAGDERVLDANSWFMVHEVQAGTRGSVSEMEDQAALIKRLNDRVYDLLTERSTLSRAQLLRRTKKKDDWMSAEEAVKLGFADRVE